MFKKCSWSGLILIFLLLAGAVAMSIPEDAHARAGGGRSYSGGRGGGRSSGRGSGGRHGSGGDGYALYFILRLIIAYPYIGIPVVIGFVYLAYKGQLQGVQSYQGSVIRRGVSAQAQAQNQSALSTLKKKDPAFQEAAFLKRVNDAFLKIQDAWCSHNLEKVRPFISDSIFERFALQIQEQKDLGYRDQMDDCAVNKTLAVQVISSEPFDVLTVKISAVSSDYRVSLETGKKISGSKLPERFIEYWSFLRRHETQTKADQPGLMEGHCPNCGAAIEMNQSTKCTHCDALLRSGAYDWVLAEITQACEWQDARPQNIPSIAAYQETDPEFNLQHLEDRASVLFWRKAMSERTGSIKPLKKIATQEYCDTFESLQKKQRQPNEKGIVEPRPFMGECAVGSVDTLGVVPGDDFDRALVEVRWSGTRFTLKDGDSPKRRSQSSVIRSLLILGRQSGVKTGNHDSVDSAHCPTCGAPEAGGTSNACEYCGEVLNDGAQDWVLLDVVPRVSPEAGNWVNQARAIQPAAAAQSESPVHAAAETLDARHLGSANVMAWMIKVLLADGVIDDKERKMLDQTAQHHGISPAQLETMLGAAQSGELDVPEPSDDKEGRDWLGAMAAMALVDGNLDKSELSVLQATGQKLGFSSIDIKMLIKKEKSRIYKNAKQALRENKARRKSFE